MKDIGPIGSVLVTSYILPVQVKVTACAAYKACTRGVVRLDEEYVNSGSFVQKNRIIQLLHWKKRVVLIVSPWKLNPIDILLNAGKYVAEVHVLLNVLVLSGVMAQSEHSFEPFQT